MEVSDVRSTRTEMTERTISGHTTSKQKEEAMSSRFEGTRLSSKTPPDAMPPLTYENNRMRV